MAEIKQYLDILTDSLQKKKDTLKQLVDLNKKQEEAFKDNGNIELFDEIVREKGQLITYLGSLDYGFEMLYERIKDDLGTNKTLYKSEISGMQSLIKEITELSIAIQTSEQRNKALVDNYFNYARGQIRQAKKSVRVASDYYKTMSQSAINPSMLMDQKK